MDNSSSNPYLNQTSANTGIQRGNNQGFNNTAVNNPYNIQNQGQIGGYSNQQYNPYQANQLRNWNWTYLIENKYNFRLNLNNEYKETLNHRDSR